MNKTQKEAVFSLVGTLVATAGISCPFISIFVLKTFLPIIVTAYLSLIAFFALPIFGFFLLRKKQSPAEPDSDERDNLIKQKAALAAFIAVWVLLIITSVIPPLFVGQTGSIPVVFLPVINFVIFLVAMTIYSIAILVQYRRGGEDG